MPNLILHVQRDAAKQEDTENEPLPNPKGNRNKKSITQRISTTRCKRFLCPAGYILTEGSENIDCAAMMDGCTWRICCVLDPDM